MPTVIALHDVPLASGSTIGKENLAIKHSIPLVTLVEIVGDPDYPTVHDGLRLFVHSQVRDCDGSAVYILTHDFRTIGRETQPTASDDESQRIFSFFHRGATIGSFGEGVLKVVKPAEEVLPLLVKSGYIFDGKKVISDLLVN